jgi:non-canonical purine NTP pyrophosphatase (RdgB/HAM1 family)
VKDVVFVTGNQHKADYLARLLGRAVPHQKLDLDEIQSADPEVVARRKALQAYETLGRPVLIDDVSLGFAALGGMPGPFIRFFDSQDDGLEMLCRMLDGFSDRSAAAECVLAYCDDSGVRLFHGRMNGVIADHPRGTNGFGWDQVFCPEGYGGKTRAELDAADDEATYTTLKPFAVLRDFLDSRER